MKKVIIIASVLSMLLAATACGSGASPADSPSATPSQAETTAAETVAPTEATTEALLETETEAPTEAESDAPTEATTEEETSGQITEVSAQVVDAAAIMDYLIANTPNIGNFVEYDEATDTNGLLGRPGQYTSKINFAITTLEQNDENDPKGGSIEVFANSEDAEARYTYIQELGQSMPILAEYDYLNEYVLLRIDYDVLPSEEKVYEEAVAAYMASLQ